MKALVCKTFGPIEELKIQNVEAPRPNPDQVLIDVKWASLNFPDALMVQGRYQIKPPLPFSPGMDLAGIVLAVGREVKQIRVGDRVMAFPGYGALAEQCVAPHGKVYRIPPELPLDSGAAFGLTYATAIHAFTQCTQLKANTTVLVLGAAGGVGVAAIEVAKAMGAQVIAAASSSEKLALCRSLGVDRTINYNNEDLRQQALDITGGRGVDVVFDPVGGDYTLEAFRALSWGGRLLVVGFAAGSIPKIPLNLALLSERQIIGVFWGSWAGFYPDAHHRNMDQLAQWFAAGTIHPVISERIELAQVPQAMHRLMTRKIQGKVVVRVQPD